MFLNISIFRHILCRLKTDEKRNKYRSSPCKNKIPRKRTEKPHFYFRKYGNGIPQIRKQTDKNRKRNGSEREYFRPFSTLVAVLVLLDSSSDFIQTHPYPELKKNKGFEKLMACSMTHRR